MGRGLRAAVTWILASLAGGGLTVAGLLLAGWVESLCGASSKAAPGVVQAAAFLAVGTVAAFAGGRIKHLLDRLSPAVPPSAARAPPRGWRRLLAEAECFAFGYLFGLSVGIGVVVAATLWWLGHVYWWMGFSTEETVRAWIFYASVLSSPTHGLLAARLMRRRLGLASPPTPVAETGTAGPPRDPGARPSAPG